MRIEVILAVHLLLLDHLELFVRNLVVIHVIVIVQIRHIVLILLKVQNINSLRLQICGNQVILLILKIHILKGLENLLIIQHISLFLRQLDKLLKARLKFIRILCIFLRNHGLRGFLCSDLGCRLLCRLPLFLDKLLVFRQFICLLLRHHILPAASRRHSFIITPAISLVLLLHLVRINPYTPGRRHSTTHFPVSSEPAGFSEAPPGLFWPSSASRGPPHRSYSPTAGQWNCV